MIVAIVVGIIVAAAGVHIYANRQYNCLLATFSPEVHFAVAITGDGAHFGDKRSEMDRLAKTIYFTGTVLKYAKMALGVLVVFAAAKVLS